MKFISSVCLENEEIKIRRERRSDPFQKRNHSGFINYVILCLPHIYIDSVLLTEAVFVSDFIDA